MDRHWFRLTGLTAEALKAELAAGKGRRQNPRLGRRRTHRTNASRGRSSIGAPITTNAAPDGDVETLEFFTERVGALSKTREDAKTWFDYLDLDDDVTFGGKP